MKNEDMTQDQQDELRDKFAMSAMNGLIPVLFPGSTTHLSHDDLDWLSTSAYQIADSMMAARYAKEK